MPRIRECDYCGDDIQPGTGTMFVYTDGTTVDFCSSKCEKNAELGREARSLEWTEAGRAQKGPAVEQPEPEPEPEPDVEADDEAADEESATPDLEEAEAEADEEADAETDEVDAEETEEAEAEADDEAEETEAVDEEDDEE